MMPIRESVLKPVGINSNATIAPTIAKGKPKRMIHDPLTILVPQGPEYQSVCRGLSDVTAAKPPVFPIPVGSQPLTRYLEKWLQAGQLGHQKQPRVLLMGVCGSLTPRHSLGDVVLYKNCIDSSDVSTLSQMQSCDPEFTTLLYEALKEKATLVQALTSDRLIYSATEKRALGQKYSADVVDMEGFAALKVLHQAGVAVAMVRVVSDDCAHNLPNLTAALSPEGSLQPFPLAIGMIRQPIAAMRLIRGSLHGLQVLQQVTTLLFS